MLGRFCALPVRALARGEAVAIAHAGREPSGSCRVHAPELQRAYKAALSQARALVRLGAHGRCGVDEPPS